MDNTTLMIILGFVVFFTAALIGIKVSNGVTEENRIQTDRYCREERARVDTEVKKRMQNLDSEVLAKQKSIEAASLEKMRQAEIEHRAELKRIQSYVEAQYKYLTQLDSTIAEKEKRANAQIEINRAHIRESFEQEYEQQKTALEKEKVAFEEKREILLKEIRSNLTAIPYLAKIIADVDTRGLEIMASSLDWGVNVARQKKVTSLRELRSEVKEAIAASKTAEYQLAYAIQMFPALEDFLETEYSQLPDLSLSDIGSENRDTVRDYLSKEEYMTLTNTERNQLALDRYWKSHRKTKWQIGRDYELFVGYKYSLDGFSIDYYGSYYGLEDLGRDLIASKDGLTLIIQCKYWGAGKLIRENHINQLYGTMVCYCYENKLSQENVRAVLVTNITVSDTARSFANYLGVDIIDNLASGSYPCIKCNINRDEDGNTTKIYHLPFDQQYDACKIDAPGEFFAMTVAEAEAAGFRRAFRWHSESS